MWTSKIEIFFLKIDINSPAMILFIEKFLISS